MALTSCYECGDVVSNLAEACPHCGAPRRDKLIHAASIGKMEIVQKIIDDAQTWMPRMKKASQR